MRSLPRPERACPPHPRVVSRAVMTHAPTPDLPRGAGGPPLRAAGRVSSRGTAIVLEADPLARLLVVPAVVALGFAVPDWPEALGDGRRAAASQPAVAVAAVFVPLDHDRECPRVCAEAPARRAAPAHRASHPASPPVVGYGRGPLAPLAAHRIHGCADLVLRLCAVGGKPRFAHLPPVGPVSAAGLSTREADVLILLLAGCTTAAVAARLCVTESTARTHCRAVLRKFGAGDRRALRARLLASPALVSPADPEIVPPPGPGDFGLRFA